MGADTRQSGIRVSGIPALIWSTMLTTSHGMSPAARTVSAPVGAGVSYPDLNRGVGG
jgi:hypothetical protein